jgi:hypothetical protein
LYYDPDLGSYYQYDDQLKTYTLHSRVDLPECQMRRKQPEREVEIILIDEDELSGQLLIMGSWIPMVELTLCRNVVCWKF